MIPKSGHRFLDQIMRQKWETTMNKHIPESDLVTPKVTTGPIAGSRKIYAGPDAASDLQVPLGEAALERAAVAGLRSVRPVYRSRCGDCCRARAVAPARRMGARTRRRRGLRRP